MILCLDLYLVLFIYRLAQNFTMRFKMFLLKLVRICNELSNFCLFLGQFVRAHRFLVLTTIGSANFIVLGDNQNFVYICVIHFKHCSTSRVGYSK